MRLKLNPAAVKIVDTLAAAGYTAEIVGGAVRDMILNTTTSDWDITTNATPEQIEPLFTDSFYDNEYGTVKVAARHLKEQFELGELVLDDSMIFDITTYRTEEGYSDSRRPDTVTWGATIEEDLRRRDFTINAIAIRISDLSTVPSLPAQAGDQLYECEVIDPFGGVSDIEAKIIRAVGDAEERFDEDALRIMRAIRLASQLGFVIETETLSALKTKVSKLANISWERIGAEVMKLLGTDHAADGVLLMANTGALELVIPELVKCRGVVQGGHHTHDVYTHLIESLRGCPSSNPVVRLATLLHDIDKPTVMTYGGPRSVMFHNHEVVGARTAKKIADRLKLPKKDQDRVFALVRWHMFHYDPKMTDAAIRRFIRRVGVENIHDMIDLRIGDRIGSGSKTTSWRLTELQKRVGEQLYEPLSLKDMVVDGSDVMRILSIAPSKKIGVILNTLFEEIIEDSSRNTKEYLEKRISDFA